MSYNTIKFHKRLHTNEGLYDIFGTEVVKGWLGNGFCDDQLNKVECNFDGGDCCLISASAIENEDSVLLLNTIN